MTRIARLRPGIATICVHLGKWASQVWTLDLRSLAQLRIGLALIVLADLGMRIRDLHAHYTDAGIVPRSVLAEFGPPSLHILGGSACFQTGLFVLGAGFAGMMLIGWRTQLATSASWLLLLSLQRRNPAILNGGDILLVVLLFWAQFLPLGARWSLDNRKAVRRHVAATVVSLATAAFILQLCFVYWFTALLKNNPSWRDDGSAVWYALSIKQLTKPMGTWLLHFPAFLTMVTFATFWLEALVPALIFMPFKNGLCRLIAIGTFVAFHLVLFSCMRIGLFSAVCIVAWLALLPGEFWDSLSKRQGLLKRMPGTMTPDRQSCFHVGINAAHRASDGVKSWAIGLLLIYVFLWNIRTVDFDRFKRYFPTQLNSIGIVLGLGQKWAMFTTPLREDGWFIVEAATVDGRGIDLWHQTDPISWQAPDSVYDEYANARWQKFMMNLYTDRAKTHGQGLARFLARRWEAKHPGDKLQQVHIYYMQTLNLAEYRSSLPEKQQLACFERTQLD